MRALAWRGRNLQEALIRRIASNSTEDRFGQLDPLGA
jgi:hypothetical protein